MMYISNMSRSISETQVMATTRVWCHTMVKAAIASAQRLQGLRGLCGAVQLVLYRCC